METNKKKGETKFPPELFYLASDIDKASKDILNSLGVSPTSRDPLGTRLDVGDSTENYVREELISVLEHLEDVKHSVAKARIEHNARVCARKLMFNCSDSMEDAIGMLQKVKES